MTGPTGKHNNIAVSAKRSPGRYQRTTERETAIGLILATFIVAGWISLHVFSLFFFVPTIETLPLALMLIALNAWLSVGLFIVAHDCMHGTLAVGRPALNRAIGQTCLWLYAGFSFDRVNTKHHLHHRHAGTPHDPDFHAVPPNRFWPWLTAFMGEYMTLGVVLHLAVRSIVYAALMGAPLLNVIVLWALPAILSAIQLFYFGTYLPHRPSAVPFEDQHKARSNDYPWLVSLFTCFHFGYHHEHHLFPWLPWWRLPEARSDGRSEA